MARRDDMAVCVAKANRYETIETFVWAQINNLPARVELLYGPNLDTVGEDRYIGPRYPWRLFCSAVPERLGWDCRGWLSKRQIKRHFRRTGVRAVLAQYGVTAVKLADACAEAGVPLVVHFHGQDAYRTKIVTQLREDYARLFRSCAAVVAVSHDMEEQLVSLGATREKVRYNPCGVDCNRFTPTDPSGNPPLFVGVGRFVEKKAPHLTLLAFRRVLERCPEARLMLIGDGPLLPACRDMAGALGMADAVRLPGTLPHDEVAAAMAGARACVQHSVRAWDGDCEGTPVSVLEAGASGLPVVATRHAGIKDVVVDGETGLLVEERDVGAMAERMIALVQDPELAGRLGRAARERIRAEFSMEKSIAGLWKIIETAVHGGPSVAG